MRRQRLVEYLDLRREAATAQIEGTVQLGWTVEEVEREVRGRDTTHSIRVRGFQQREWAIQDHLGSALHAGHHNIHAAGRRADKQDRIQPNRWDGGLSGDPAQPPQDGCRD